MGYLTRFNLKIKYLLEDGTLLEVGDPKVYEEIETASESFNDWYGGGTIKSVLYDDADSMKWYGWEEDMREFSKLFPDIVFVLEGEGEESGDIWCSYFKDGKNQYCQARIVVDEFDHDMLE